MRRRFKTFADYWGTLSAGEKISIVIFMNQSNSIFGGKPIDVPTLPFLELGTFYARVKDWFSLGNNSQDLEHYYPAVAKMYHRTHARKELR